MSGPSPDAATEPDGKSSESRGLAEFITICDIMLPRSSPSGLSIWLKNADRFALLEIGEITFSQPIFGYPLIR